MKYTTCDHTRIDNREQSRHHKWREKKPRMRQWSEKHHLPERQNTETHECSSEGDWRWVVLPLWWRSWSLWRE